MTTRRQAVMQAIAAHDVPFAWGTHDCVTFALAVVERLQGRRPLDPTWRTADEADAAVAARGGLHAAISDVLGRPYDLRAESPQDGDVVLVRAPGFEMAAVWAGVGPIGASSRGIIRLSPARAVAGWRV